jgi:hypothetical protein
MERVKITGHVFCCRWVVVLQGPKTGSQLRSHFNPWPSCVRSITAIVWLWAQRPPTQSQILISLDYILSAYDDFKK